MNRADLSPRELLGAPTACAFLLFADKANVPLARALRPPFALDLAAKALYVLDPWSGHQSATIREVVDAAASLESLADRVSRHSATDWWFSPLDRVHQIWLSTSRDGTSTVVTPSTPADPWAVRWQRPRFWFTTATRFGRRSALHSLLAQQAGDWDPEFPLPSADIEVEAGARIFEINGPDDWHQLAARYPLPTVQDTTTASREMVPDWALVAEDWDGIHLTFGGFLLSAFVTVSGASGWSTLRTWESESALWLRQAFSRVIDRAPLPKRPRKIARLGRLDLPSSAPNEDSATATLRRHGGDG